MRAACIFLLLMAGGLPVSAGTVGRADLNAQSRHPSIRSKATAFVRYNGDRFCNRPLYANQIPAVVLAGETSRF